MEHGPRFEWILVRNVPLPPGWNTASIDVLVVLGPGFPSTPPDNFYVPAGLRLANGAVPSNFQPSAFNHDGKSWDMFSWHHESGWAPSAAVESGSNLLSFMLEAERRLNEVN